MASCDRYGQGLVHDQSCIKKCLPELLGVGLGPLSRHWYQRHLPHHCCPAMQHKALACMGSLIGKERLPGFRSRSETSPYLCKPCASAVSLQGAMPRIRSFDGSDDNNPSHAKSQHRQGQPRLSARPLLTANNRGGWGEMHLRGTA